MTKILYFFIFIIVGELTLRTDKKYDLLNNSPTSIEAKMEVTSLMDSVDDGTLALEDHQIRVMVLGDSYIYGAGIKKANKFSERLAITLKTNVSDQNDVIVLDISRPGNNTTDNFRTFQRYEKLFKPHFIFWAYNINDVDGEITLNPNDEKQQKQNSESETKPSTKKTEKNRKNVIAELFDNIELASFLYHKLDNELKLKGYVIPRGDFHFLTQQAYSDKSKEWQTTKKIITKTSEICQKNGGHLIFYKLPEFNLLEQPALFYNINKSLGIYFDQTPEIDYISDLSEFQGENLSQYKQSNYDGHPNELAHDVLASKIADFILKKIDQTD